MLKKMEPKRKCRDCVHCVQAKKEGWKDGVYFSRTFERCGKSGLGISGEDVTCYMYEEKKKPQCRDCAYYDKSAFTDEAGLRHNVSWCNLNAMDIESFNPACHDFKPKGGGTGYHD